MSGRGELEELREPGGARKHFERLFRSALFLTSDAHVAEDLAQETLAEALAGASRFRGASKLGVWLRAILVNRVRKWRRRKLLRDSRRVAGMLLECIADARPDPGEASAESEDRHRFWTSVEALSSSDREVLSLRYVDGLPCQEIASVLGTTETAVKKRLHRARQRLRPLLEVSLALRGAEA